MGDPLSVVEALLAGLAIGAVLGLIGAGGAVVAVPVFLYVFDFTPVQATTASLAVVAVAATTGAVPRLRLRQVDLRQALLFWVLGIAGTFVGARLVTVIPDTAVVIGFVAVMVVAASAMWRKSDATQPPEPRRRPRWLLPVVASGGGLLTGLFGVGGGFLIVPALVLVFDLPFALATGTSLVVVALNSLTALLFKVDTWPDIPWHLPLLVVGAALVGSVVASTVNHGIPARRLERAFAVLLVLLAAGMVVEAGL